MRSFHRTSMPRSEALPVGESILIIGALSALSWAVVIAVVMAIRAAL